MIALGFLTVRVLRILLGLLRRLGPLFFADQAFEFAFEFFLAFEHLCKLLEFFLHGLVLLLLLLPALLTLLPTGLAERLADARVGVAHQKEAAGLRELAQSFGFRLDRRPTLARFQRRQRLSHFLRGLFEFFQLRWLAYARLAIFPELLPGLFGHVAGVVAQLLLLGGQAREVFGEFLVGAGFPRGVGLLPGGPKRSLQDFLLPLNQLDDLLDALGRLLLLFHVLPGLVFPFVVGRDEVQPAVTFAGLVGHRIAVEHVRVVGDDLAAPVAFLTQVDDFSDFNFAPPPRGDLAQQGLFQVFAGGFVDADLPNAVIVGGTDRELDFLVDVRRDVRVGLTDLDFGPAILERLDAERQRIVVGVVALVADADLVAVVLADDKRYRQRAGIFG